MCVVKYVISDIIKEIIKDKTGKESSIVTDMMTYNCIEPLEPQIIDVHMEQYKLMKVVNIMAKIAYVRVSTLEQNTERQEVALKEIGNRKYAVCGTEIY